MEAPQKPQPKEPLKQSKGKSFAKYSAVSFQMAVVICLGVWGGVKLDERLGTEPIFAVALSLLAVGGAMASLILSLKD